MIHRATAMIHRLHDDVLVLHDDAADDVLCATR